MIQILCVLCCDRKAASLFAFFVLTCDGEGADRIIAVFYFVEIPNAAPKAEAFIVFVGIIAHVYNYFSSNPHSRAACIYLRQRGGLFARINVSCHRRESRENGINSSNTRQTEGNGFLYFACWVPHSGFGAAGPCVLVRTRVRVRAVIKKHVTRRNSVTH